jgi:predicted RNA-binding Zn-ribbon protein involved in translation (DUF1610 family)
MCEENSKVTGGLMITSRTMSCRCPDCGARMVWRALGNRRLASGAIVQDGFWLCTRPSCPSRRPRGPAR